MERRLERSVIILLILYRLLIRQYLINQQRSSAYCRSPEWQFIPEDEKEEVGLTFDRDGEFWMSFRDFSAQYSRLEIVNLNADSLEEEELSGDHSKRWSANEFAGNWVKGASAGGCRNHLGMLFYISLSSLRINCDRGSLTI